MKTKTAFVSLSLGLASLFAVSVANAGTLENLERERALTLGAMLEPELAPAERQSKLAAAKPRLVDLERMVMRDPSLKGKDTPAVRRAFNNYDLTFLLHASVEKNRTLMDHWLEQMGISTGSVMNARMGRR